jgi:hypothetical protein
MSGRSLKNSGQSMMMYASVPEHQKRAVGLGEWILV